MEGIHNEVIRVGLVPFLDLFLLNDLTQDWEGELTL